MAQIHFSIYILIFRWIYAPFFMCLDPSDFPHECKITIEPSGRQFSNFVQNGKYLESWTKQMLIKEGNTSACFVNTSALVDDLSYPEEVVIGTFIFKCQQNTDLGFTRYNGSRHSNIISYIVVSRCNTSVSAINEFAKTTDTRVIAYANCHVTTCKGCDAMKRQCQALEAVVTFDIYNRNATAVNLTEILACATDFPQMAEVTFYNMSWDKVPVVVRKKFPNLQALDIAHNNFKLPPDFPWTDEVVNLPRNLSRSPYFQNHYSETMNLFIPANIFRRIFNLANNNITDLSRFEFHGFLHMIVLQSNGLELLGNNTFSNVTGLQNLDLSFNKLKFIPELVFSGMEFLKHLNLKQNQIEGLKVGLFDCLSGLQYLDLSNNALRELGPGLFSSLRSLQELHLEFNTITYLDEDTFPIDSTKLEKIFLRNNPIHTLPEFLFWIRRLNEADLQWTLINFNNMTGWLASLDLIRIAEGMFEPNSPDDIDFTRKNPNMRLIDLSNSQIEHINLGNMTTKTTLALTLIINNAKFNLDGNPLKCSCKILPVLKFFDGLLANGTIEGNEYYYHKWKCVSPSELKDKPLLSIKPEETYCEQFYTNCPDLCTCYQRSITESVIIDCRRAQLLEIHHILPAGKLELWYQENNISTLEPRQFMNRVISMNLAYNKVRKIDPAVLSQLGSIKTVHLQSNLLSELPRAFQYIEFKEITLRHNPFRCDCKTVWMKSWISRSKHFISDWDVISCNDESEQGRQFVNVPNNEFTCTEEFSSIRHVVLPSVVCSVIFLLCLVGCVILYAYRLECKVLMYVYLGVHPFDNDNPNDEENVDAVIVHSGSLTDWVMDQIVDVLEGRDLNFVVCDMDRDFVIGYSFQEILSRTVRHSKRMILCVSEDWGPANQAFKIAWNSAKEKIKESKSNYVIIINNGISMKHIEDKDLRTYFQRGRYIDSNRKLLIEKVLYLMPVKSDIRKRLSMRTLGRFTTSAYKINEAEEECFANCHAFLSYADSDMDFIINEIQPGLEEKGYKLCIPDRDFIPGAAKEENILKSIDTALRTIFVLSQGFAQDEWLLFTFRTALEKSLREKSNHLIVIVRGGIIMDSLDEEIVHYLNSYIWLSSEDRWFWQKLDSCLPLLNNQSSDTVEIENVHLIRDDRV